MYDIDSIPQTLEVNFVNRGTSLTKNQWDRLPEEAQAIWDTLPPKAKTTTLEPRPPRPPRRIPPNDTNLHEISVHDYIQANFHDQHTGSSDDKAEQDKIDNGNNNAQNSQASFQSESELQTLLVDLPENYHKHTFTGCYPSR